MRQCFLHYIGFPVTLLSLSIALSCNLFQTGGAGGNGVPSTAVLPIDCQEAVRMLTTDWLSANLTQQQVAQLRTEENLSLIGNASTADDLNMVFAGVGVPDFEDFLVRDIIQKDLACHEDRLVNAPAYPVDEILPYITEATLAFLQR